MQLSFYYKTAGHLEMMRSLHSSIFPNVKNMPKSSYNTQSVVCWGWKSTRKIAKMNKNILVMERAYLGDRFAWTSLGWNGLNGYANFFNENVPSDRWEKYWKKDMKPWRGDQGDYVLVCGQVPTDAALYDCPDYSKFLTDKIQELQKRFGKVAFRPHPLTSAIPMAHPMLQPITQISNITIIDPKTSTLNDNLQHTRFLVTWSSNSLVEAMYNGIPFESHSPGSMVHNYQTGFDEPNRDDWGRKIAYCQWSLDELADGTAWNHIKQGLI